MEELLPVMASEKEILSRDERLARFTMVGVLVIQPNKSQFPIFIGKDWDNLLPRK